jgi:hypothetical protein
MSDALFDSDDDDGANGPPTNVLAVAAVAESSDALTTRAQICRDPDYKHATMVILEDDEGEFSNAKQFMRGMGLYRLPTMDEAGAWLIAKRDAVDARAAARALDRRDDHRGDG